MQKKWIAACLAIALIAMPISGFAEDNSLDDDYIDAMFGKLSKLNDDKKDMYSFGLKLKLRDKEIDNFENNWKTELKEHQIKALYDLGLTDRTIESNIAKLKNWTESDRHKLVNYAKNDEQENVEALNNSYSESAKDEKSDSKSSPSGGNKGGGSSKVDPVETNEEVQEESVPQGVITKSDQLVSNGIRVNKLQAIPGLNAEHLLDLQGHWSSEYVEFFVNSGIVKGRSDNRFEPDESITKAEIITMIAKTVIQDPTKISANKIIYSDVKESDWYVEYFSQLESIGINLSDESKVVNANGTPTRQEIVKLFMDTISALDISIDESTPSVLEVFSDANQIKPKNFNAMQDAVALGLIKGMGDGSLAPNDTVKRGQIAVMLKHFHEYIISKLEEAKA